MKKITFTAIALMCALVSFAQITLTQNVDPVTIDGGIVCSNDAPSSIVAYRTYSLEAFGVENDFVVSSVEWGASGLTGAVDYEVTLTLWSADDEDLTGAEFTEIASEVVVVQEDEAGVLISTPFVANVPAGTQLVFTVSYPNDGVTFPAAGTNNAGQNSPSFASGDCIPGISDLEEFALSNAWVMNVVGEDVALNTDENALSQISIYPNPATDVLNIAVPSSIDVKSVSLFDVLGKKANVSLVNGQVDISELAVGLYLLNVETTNGTLTQKVIKQ